MRKGNPDMEACDSMEKGVITMYNKIISGINSEYDILLEEVILTVSFRETQSFMKRL